MAIPATSYRTGAPALDDDSLLHWLAFRLTPGLGTKSALLLLERFGSPQALFRASAAEIEDAGAHPGVARSLASGCAFEEAADQVDRCKAAGVTVLPIRHDLYPPRLREIYDPPVVLFARGRTELLDSVQVALVGSRRASSYGLAVAERLGHDLAAAGVTVVSGMARGIDTAAHRAALEAGGNTVAVYGCGIDLVYPSENRKLADRIAQEGLLLSEFPMGTPAYPQNFPVRNRIVSGLSSGVVVIEGAQYSGSSITARLALDQNREVFAVPGNITAAMSWGPNLLIKQGAHLVQDYNDILGALSIDDRLRLVRGASLDSEQKAAKQQSLGLGPMDRLSQQILSLLSLDSPIGLDELLARLEDASSSEVIAALFELEIAGRIRQLAGRRYVKVWTE